MTAITAAARPWRLSSDLARYPVRRLDRHAITLWLLQILAAWAAVLAVEVLAVILTSSPIRLIPTALLGLSLPIAAMHAVLVPPWRYRVHRWDVDDDQVVARSGWFVQQTRIAPLTRIQTVDARRGPLARLLGLTTVRITTASSAGAVTIVGLSALDAEQLVERLALIVDQVEGDAT